MADETTTTKSKSSQSDLEKENAQLRRLLEERGVDIAGELDPNAGIVGNLADLQRLGKLAVNAGKTSVEDAVVVPASVDPDTGDSTPPQTAAGNEIPTEFTAEATA